MISSCCGDHGFETVSSNSFGEIWGVDEAIGTGAKPCFHHLAVGFSKSVQGGHGGRNVIFPSPYLYYWRCVKVGVAVYNLVWVSAVRDRNGPGHAFHYWWD